MTPHLAEQNMQALQRTWSFKIEIRREYIKAKLPMTNHRTVYVRDYSLPKAKSGDIILD